MLCCVASERYKRDCVTFIRCVPAHKGYPLVGQASSSASGHCTPSPPRQYWRRLLLPPQLQRDPGVSFPDARAAPCLVSAAYPLTCLLSLSPLASYRLPTLRYRTDITPELTSSIPIAILTLSSLSLKSNEQSIHSTPQHLPDTTASARLTSTNIFTLLFLLST